MYVHLCVCVCVRVCVCVCFNMIKFPLYLILSGIYYVELYLHTFP